MKIKKPLPILIISCLLLIVSSNVAFAETGGIVPCNPRMVTEIIDGKTVSRIVDQCTFCDFLQLGKNLITWMAEIALVLGTAFIVWGGFVIMTAGGLAENVGKGREVITIAVVGVAITLASWLILGTIINVVTGSPSVLPWTEVQCQ